MVKVQLRSTKDPTKTKVVNSRDARTLVKLGGWEYADDAARAAAAPPTPPRPDYSTRTVAQLRQTAKDRNLTGLSGASKAELVDALEQDDRGGRYRRRDMRAAE